MDIPPLSPTFYRPFHIDAGPQSPGSAAVAAHQEPAIATTGKVAAVGQSDKSGATYKHRPESNLPGESYSNEEVESDKQTVSTEGEHQTGANDPEQRAEFQKIRELQQRDREVRAHEAAHAAVGGHLTGAPSYSYERGPDGVNYAVSGEVSVASPSVSGDPATTLQQAEQLQRAALAPVDPSPQDRKVAAEAARTAAEARLQLMQMNSEKRGGETHSKDTTSESGVAGDGKQQQAEDRRQAISAYQSGAEEPSLMKGIDTRV